VVAQHYGDPTTGYTSRCRKLAVNRFGEVPNSTP